MPDHRQPPGGFARHSRHSPLTEPWEPLWSRRGDAGFSLGLWLDERHCNARGLAHGGLITTLADNAMGLAAVLASVGVASGAVTANLSINFLAAARPGQWLAVVATPSQVGRTLGFVEAVISADDLPVARASGLFRMLSEKETDR